MNMKTQVILKTKKYDYNLEELVRSFINAYALDLKPMLEEGDTYKIYTDMWEYISKNDLIKPTMYENVYIEVEGFVSAEANKVIDEENNEIFVFVDSFIKTEDNKFVKKFIYENVKNKEKVRHTKIASDMLDFLVRRFKEKTKK